MTDESLSERLRAESDWAEATHHRFTRELLADEIADSVFRRYLVQDYAFVGTLGRVVGYASAQAPTREAQGRLGEFLATLAGAEDDYFRRSFDALGVPEENYADPDLAPITREFQDFLLRAARDGGYEETLAVLLAVEWAYLDWATADDLRPDSDGVLASDSEVRADSLLSRPYLAEWVELHATDEFGAFVGWLRDELDRYGPGLHPRRHDRVRRFFCRAVELEAAFFDGAYAGDSGNPK
jgi:thiaminase/transcriptional activator TenA